MHGSRLSLAEGALAAALGTHTSAPAAPASGHGLRHFLKETPSEVQQFKVAGRPAHLPENREAVRQLMVRLAAALENDDLAAPTERPLALSDNSNLPSGYTYLLQFVGHDLVQSTLSLAVLGDGDVAVTNNRLSPLRLDTAYGGGPDICPHVYAAGSNGRGSQTTVPRTALRLGRIQPIGDPTRPGRDIARTNAGTADRGGATGFGEALIADPRNDEHAMLSQLTVLFHLLHNGMLQRIGAIDTGDRNPVRAAYARFLCARVAVTAIYRNIVVHDLMRRLLDEAVYRHYLTHPGVDPWDGRIPLEFSHGVFRLGHAMVRQKYRINSERELEVSAALMQSSARSPQAMPIEERWVVRWSHFFEIPGSGIAPNLSRRLRPTYTSALLSNDLFGAVDDTGRAGLPYRDLLSSAFAGLWSVPALIDELRSRLRALDIPEYGRRRPQISQWLARRPLLSPADIETLSNDPPLPFFVLFEAANDKAGERLGLVGSIIVAETVFGALNAGALIGEDWRAPFGDQLQAAARRFLGQRDALDFVPPIETMPQLIEFMGRQLAVGDDPHPFA